MLQVTRSHTFASIINESQAFRGSPVALAVDHQHKRIPFPALLLVHLLNMEKFNMADSWDCHVDCFDAVKYPFKQSRSYTPSPGTLDTLTNAVRSRNLVITQASIEDGVAGIQEVLERVSSYPDLGIVRGAIMATNLQSLDGKAIEKLHSLGVRSVRVHGAHGGAGDNLNWISEQFRLAAASAAVKKHGWYISAQLPLQSWACLGPLISGLGHVTIVLDHNASACPSDLESPAFTAFLNLLRAQNVVVKVGAFHRRSFGDIDAMRPIVEAFIARAPDRIIIGSDWPHMDASQGGTMPTQHLQHVDTARELHLLSTWMSKEQWDRVMRSNPNRLFAR
jgi:predicted TIM-barrel fold metal-dependent hydrolase